MKTNNSYKFTLSEKRHSTILYIVLLQFIVLMVLGAFIKTGIDGYNRAMFNDMINGTAHKPFVYRSLVPFTVKAVSSLIPDKVHAELNNFGKAHGQKFASIDFTYFLITSVIWYLSFLGFAFAFYKLADSLYNVGYKFMLPLSLAAVAGLPVLFKYYSYVYDPTHLFLFTLCLYLLSERKWTAYLIFLLITTLSKETSVLLIMIFYLVYRKSVPAKKFYRLLALQIIIFIAVKLFVSLIFMHNPGTFVEFHLRHNLTLDAYSVSQFTALSVILIAVIYDWKNKPEFLRLSLWIIAPLLLLTFFLGYIDEYRDYSEVYPVVFLLAAHSAARVLNISPFEIRRK